jgi:hypothetical protein
MRFVYSSGIKKKRDQPGLKRIIQSVGLKGFVNVQDGSIHITDGRKMIGKQFKTL